MWEGTELTADAALGATTISVGDSESIAAEENVWVGSGGPYTVLEVLESTLVLATGLVTAQQMVIRWFRTLGALLLACGSLRWSWKTLQSQSRCL